MGPQTLEVTVVFTNLPPTGLHFSQLVDVRQALASAAGVPLAQVMQATADDGRRRKLSQVHISALAA